MKCSLKIRLFYFQLHIAVDEFSSQDNLVQKVRTVKYTGGYTNIADGLRVSIL